MPGSPPVAPPGWHFQPGVGRWLWWDGYRWIDPAATWSPIPPNAVSDPDEAPERWWPPLTPIRFPAAIVTAVFMVAMFATQLWVAGSADEMGLGTAVLGLVVLAMSVLGMPAVALACAHHWGSRGALRSIGVRVRWIDLPLGVVTAVVMYAAMIVINLLTLGFGAETGSNLEGVGADGISGGYFLFLLVLAGLLAPITEELLFRGAMLRGLLDKLGTWPSLIVQSVIFGSMHFTPDQGWGNLNLILSLSVLGLCLGIITKATGRLGAAVIAHAIFNSANLLLLWLVAA